MSLWQCKSAPRPGDETGNKPDAGWQDPRGFDPLELPQDSENVPARHPRTDPIIGRQAIVEVEDTPAAGDSTTALPPGTTVMDSSNSQAYRVQLLSSRVYKEARDGARVAEEIFDQPVYVDYEVPNYKVRVGNFADRPAAEDYLQRARAAGYANAWVAVVNLRVREVAPLYEQPPVGAPPPPTVPPDSTGNMDDGE